MMWLTNSENVRNAPTPTLLYLMNSDQMIKFIVRVSHMNKKVIEKAEKLLKSNVVEVTEDEES